MCRREYCGSARHRPDRTPRTVGWRFQEEAKVARTQCPDLRVSFSGCCGRIGTTVVAYTA